MLAVLYHGLALCDVADGEFVVDGDVLGNGDGHRLAREEKRCGLSCGDRLDGYRNVYLLRQ